MFLSYHDTKGETSFAKGFYHIRLKTAHPRLPSSEQVFLDLPPLQFTYSKRFLTAPKQEDGSIPIRHLTLLESLSALIREVISYKVNGYPSKGDNCDKRMDDARFLFCSTVFKSCQDDGREIMKLCNVTPFTSEKISASDRARTRDR